MAIDFVSVEGEIHFLDVVSLGAGAEGGFRARRAAAEEDAVAGVPQWIIAQLLIFDDRKVIGTAPSSSTRS